MTRYDAIFVQSLKTECDRRGILLTERETEIRTLNDEIEVLTQERDNALLRIEELENDLADSTQVIEQQRDLIEAIREYRGGVHPNA